VRELVLGLELKPLRNLMQQRHLPRLQVRPAAGSTMQVCTHLQACKRKRRVRGV
jgi:hypothetical protein